MLCCLCFLGCDTTPFATETSKTRDETLLRTGAAVDLLGCSRQHVVDLCDQGVLPSTRVGSHRRVRRGDVMRIADGSEMVGVLAESELYVFTGGGPPSLDG